MIIRVIQIGELQPNLLNIIVEELNKKFKSKFISGERLEMPQDAYDKFRRQYLSDRIIEKLKKLKKGNEKIIALTSSDLYSHGLNFIFGQADKDVCIVSTARLDQVFYGNSQNFEQLILRTLKEVIHELGHMFGLGHCQNPICVMSFSPSVAYVDEKNVDFCKECTLKMSMEGIEI